MMSKLSWVVRCAYGVALVLIVVALATGCGSRAPRPCPTCGGTGKVQRTEQTLATYEVTEAKLINNGFFNPDYTAKWSAPGSMDTGESGCSMKPEDRIESGEEAKKDLYA